MKRILLAVFSLSAAAFAAETNAGEAKAEPKQDSKPSTGFKMPSVAEMGALAGNLAQKLDSKLGYVEQGTAALKPVVEALVDPTKGKVTPKYELLVSTLPKVRSAVDALKSGKAANPKLELKNAQEGLKTVEELYTQIQSLLPAKAGAKEEKATVKLPFSL